MCYERIPISAGHVEADIAEADYCRARAAAETEHAAAAVHPAARDAHLTLAALYEQRALAAGEADDAQFRD